MLKIDLTQKQLIRAGVVFLLALVAYMAMAGSGRFRQSIAPHFVYLADAWQRGHSDVDNIPSPYDLIVYDGRLYVAQPPLPSVMLFPAVKFFGAVNSSDIFFTILLGAAGVALCDMTLALMLPDLSAIRRSWLTVFYGFGTAAGYMSSMGTVWFTGQIAAVLFLWVLLLALHWRLWLLAGIAAGAVLLARPGIMPGILILVVGWWVLTLSPYAFSKREGEADSLVSPTSKREGETRQPIASLHLEKGWGVVKKESIQVWLVNGVLFAMPLIAALAFLGWYNHARFGSYTDLGYDYIQEAGTILERRLEHGNFSVAFFPENLYTATIRPPVIKNGDLEPDPWGMGLLLTSPVLLYGLVVLWWRSEDSRKGWLLAISSVAMMASALLYHNTGSVQFGYRFLLDALPVYMLLVGMGARRGNLYWLASATIYSVAVHIWGTAWLFSAMGIHWSLF